MSEGWSNFLAGKAPSRPTTPAIPTKPSLSFSKRLSGSSKRASWSVPSTPTITTSPAMTTSSTMTSSNLLAAPTTSSTPLRPMSPSPSPSMSASSSTTSFTSATQMSTNSPTTESFAIIPFRSEASVVATSDDAGRLGSRKVSRSTDLLTSTTNPSSGMLTKAALVKFGRLTGQKARGMDLSSPTPLTAHERYALMRQNTGRPHALVFVVTYPRSGSPDWDVLEARVMELQARLPKLCARVVGAATNRPAFRVGDVPFAAGEILQGGVYKPCASAGDEAMSVLRSEMARFEAQDFLAAPPWSVRVMYGGPSALREYLVCAFNHVWIDYFGALKIVHALTGQSLSDMPDESMTQPTRFDDTVPMAPTPRYIMPIAFREIVVPRLPKVAQSKFTRTDPWPGVHVVRSPLACGTGLCFVSLAPATVQQLTDVSKSRRLTLHPVLKMAYLASVWRVFGPGACDLALPSHYQTMRLVAATNRDERNRSLGHSAVTGCYVSSTEYETELKGTERFWAATRDLNKYITSKRGIAEGRMTLGLLSQIPDPEVDPLAPDFDPKSPTGWEAFFIERASSPAPFRDSLALTNLGVTKLPKGSTDLMWTQSASPFAPAYNVNLVGHEGGIRVTAAFREGAAVTMTQTNTLHSVWVRVINRIIDSGSDLTITELTA